MFVSKTTHLAEEKTQKKTRIAYYYLWAGNSNPGVRVLSDKVSYI